MNIELQRNETILIIERLLLRISEVESLLNIIKDQNLINEYSKELNNLKELELKLIKATNKEYNESI